MTFNGLFNMEVLNMFKNSIIIIDDEPLITNNIVLNDLSLIQNDLTVINRNLFKGFRSMSKLDLKYNRINLLNKDSFVDLISITTRFTGNKLKQINEGVFNGLKLLKELILTSIG